MSLLLSRAEVEEVTGKKRSDAQRRELVHLRVPFKERRDGSPVVLRRDFEIATGITIAPKEPELMP